MAGEFVVTMSPEWTSSPVPPREVWPDLEDKLDRLGESAVSLAQRLVPIDTADLHSTIRHEVRSTGQGPILQVLAGGLPGKSTGRVVDYAVFVELGTGSGPAQPFLRPVLQHLRGLLR